LISLSQNSYCIDGSVEIFKIVTGVVMDETFWKNLKEKPGFDWFIEARRYLQSAEVLRASPEYQQGLITTPPLHLLAHGSELLLKANLIASGCSAAEVRSFGHDLWKLWNNDKNASIRFNILTAAHEEWEAASSEPAWQGNFGDDSAIIFQEYFECLSALHSNKTDFALRYVRSEETHAPKPHLLSSTMFRVADQYVRAMIYAHE